MFRSLWWVMNGLAVAPPGMTFIIGVSTSMKLIFVRYFLTNARTLERVMNVYRVRLFIIMSRYRFLYLVYLSLRPTWASGSMCRQGDNSFTSPGKIDNYPVFVLPGLPLTPIMSPLLIVECNSWKSLSDLWLLTLHITWSFSPSPFKS